jgi:hypothetical protein
MCLSKRRRSGPRPWASAWLDALGLREREGNDDVAARVRQLVTVGWRQRLSGRIERSAAPDAGAQRDIVAGDLWPIINVSGSNLATISWLIVIFGQLARSRTA